MSNYAPELPQGIDPGMLTGGSPLQIPGGFGGMPTPDQPAPQAPPPPPDPLVALQGVIEDFIPLLVALPDPADVRDATKAMLLLQTIQHRMMTAGQSGPGQQGG